MITLSNGHSFDYVVASGVLGFDGRGGLWEKFLASIGLLRPHLFTVVTGTITRNPQENNVKMFGLKNPGIAWWIRNIGPQVNKEKLPLVVSIKGNREELVYMALMMNCYGVVGVEVSVFCSKTENKVAVQEMIDSVRAIKDASRHPVIVKVLTNQDYCTIVSNLEGLAEAVFLDSRGVSFGRPGQIKNRLAVNKLRTQVHTIPIISPSIVDYVDFKAFRATGADAVSFESIPTLNPWKTTQLVKRDMWENRNKVIGVEVLSTLDRKPR